MLFPCFGVPFESPVVSVSLSLACDVFMSLSYSLVSLSLSFPSSTVPLSFSQPASPSLK